MGFYGQVVLAIMHDFFTCHQENIQQECDTKNRTCILDGNAACSSICLALCFAAYLLSITSSCISTSFSCKEAPSITNDISLYVQRLEQDVLQPRKHIWGEIATKGDTWWVEGGTALALNDIGLAESGQFGVRVLLKPCWAAGPDIWTWSLVGFCSRLWYGDFIASLHLQAGFEAILCIKSTWQLQQLHSFANNSISKDGKTKICCRLYLHIRTHCWPTIQVLW